MDINSLDTKIYNKKENNDDVEDIGYVGVNNKFVPNPQLRSYNPRITTMANRKRGNLVTPPNTNKEENKKVSYDDILRSLNMRMDQNGVLVITRGDNSAPQAKSSTYSTPNIAPQRRPPPPQNMNPSINNQPIKNNHINKPLFAPNNYIPQQKPLLEPEPPKPLTPAQIKHNRLQYAKLILKKQEEARRINELKTKKMIFSKSYPSQSNIKQPPQSNHFFSFK
jgi:hypothetical protein